MFEYVYFAPDTDSARTSKIAAERARQMVGGRVLIGFDLVQRGFTDRDGEWVFLSYFRSPITGKVWAVYYAA